MPLSDGRRWRLLVVLLVPLGLVAVWVSRARSPRGAIVDPASARRTAERQGQPRPARSLPPPRLSPAAARQEPSSHAQFEEQRHDPVELFDREARDPVWAPAMERAIRSELTANLARLKLPGTTIHALECRKSSCRMEMDFHAEDVQRAQAGGAIHPGELLIMTGGHLASLETDVPVEGGRTMNGADESVAVLPDGSFRKTVVLTFGDADIDPRQYGAWREASAERIKQQQRADQEGR